MRFGFVGPAESSSPLLEQAVGQLVTGLEVDTIVYLGADEAIHDFITAQRRGQSELTFEQRVAEVAATGAPAEITEVVRSLRGAMYLERLRVLPQPPANAIEMLDDRIILLVREKSSIGEEDVVNSNVVVYGDAKELAFKRYGPRCFFSPGPLEGGYLGILDDEAEGGGITLRAIDLTGEVSWTEPIQGRGARMKVAP
ncbi:MAG: hypothetical protein OES69_13740 [Myxococcales bacterium]|nr:hypothetical protein [Myxococcales bacterium]MDH3845000.1 hypothetical protein [Myxococcales bacterium]